MSRWGLERGGQWLEWYDYPGHVAVWGPASHAMTWGTEAMAQMFRWQQWLFESAVREHQEGA